MKEALFEKLANCIAEGDAEEALKVVDQALAEGISPLEILDKGGTRGMDIVNERYDNGEAFLPELVVAGDAMTEVVQRIFSQMDEAETKANKIGTVVIGQAEGDVHDIGKNIVAALLAVNGFEVHDLGIDVPVKKFIEKAEEVNATIIACSTLLTTSMPYLEDVVQLLTDMGKRDKYFYIVGGGPVTPEFAEQMKADGWGRTAFDAVELCKRLVRNGAAAGTETVIVDSQPTN